MRTRIARGLVLVTVMAAAPAARGVLITNVAVSGNDAAITNAPANGTQVETDFREDAFMFTDRTHQYNGPRFTSGGVLTTAGTPAPDDVTQGLPPYLLGAEYISTNNSNRDNASFSMVVTVSEAVTAYLLIDNRVGDAGATAPPTLGSGGTGIMPWVTDDGWTLVNTGRSPGGQPDFVGIDEGATITNYNDRTTNTTNLGTGPGVSVNNYMSIYRHDFPAGTFTLFQQNDGTNDNMYGVVVTPIPEPAGIGAVTGAVFLAATRRRRGRAR